MPIPRAESSLSLVSTHSAPAMPLSTSSPKTAYANRLAGCSTSVVNLDFFQLGSSSQAPPSQNSSSTMLPPKKHVVPSNESWEHLVQDFDNPTALYDTVQPHALNKCVSNPETLDWTGDLWNLDNFQSQKANVPQSLLSFSEESLTSGDDFVFSTAGSHNGSMSTQDGLDTALTEESFKGMVMPVSSIEDELDFSPHIHA